MGAIALMLTGVGFAVGCALGSWLAVRLRLHPLLALIVVLFMSCILAVAAASIPASVMGI